MDFTLKSISQHRFNIVMVLLLCILLFPNFQAHAQEDNETWKVPLNLSRSGAASDPRVVIDSGGDLHVLWREDAPNSFYYAHKEDGQWKNPIPVEVPFGTIRYLREELGEERFDEKLRTPLFTPQLVASNDGRIHAIWIDSEGDLYHSSVMAGDFDTYESWSSRRLVSQSALGFSSVVDSENNIHLIYVNYSDTVESPAGIYYRRLSRNGESWSRPVTLFKSAYYRAENTEDLNFKIRAGMLPGDSSGLYVVLDNRPLEEVLLIRSQDRGESWEEPVVIDRRREEDPFASVGPSKIDLVSNSEQLHLMWLAGHDSPCQLIHQWSEDNALTWEPAYAMEMEFDGCPANYWLMVGSNNLLYLLTANPDGSYYLQAWNGEKWSEGELETFLSGFEDSVTLRDVALNCQQPVLDLENNLVVVGCGSSMGKDDVWIVEQPTREQEYWFPTKPKIWSDPVNFVSSENHLLEPILFSDNENLLHAFWISSGDDDETVSNAQIYYTSWNGVDWSRQVPLIQLDSKHADQLSGIFDRDEGLFLLWRDQEKNIYSYSAVKSEDILLPAEWSRPTAFPKLSSEALFSAPAPFLDDEGVLNIVYAVPLNEGRGIYLIRAGEDGLLWSEPVTVVDAVMENWAMVDNPFATQMKNGDIHVVFTVYSLGPEPIAKALYYTRSKDSGITWSDAKLIAEGDIRWSQIVGVDPSTLLIAWQEQDGDQFLFWNRQSTNGGNTWNKPSFIVEPSITSDSFDLVTQPTNQLNLVVVQADNNGELSLNQRIWNGNAWQDVESYQLETRLKNENILDLTAAGTGNGHLIAIFNTETILSDRQSPETEFFGVVQPNDQQTEVTPVEYDILANNLFFIHRFIEPSEQSVSAEPFVDANPKPNSGSTSAVVPEPSSDNSLEEEMNADGPEIDSAELNGNNGINDLTDGSTSNEVKILMGLAPAVLLILIVFMIGIRRAFPKQ